MIIIHILFWIMGSSLQKVNVSAAEDCEEIYFERHFFIAAAYLTKHGRVWCDMEGQ